MSDPLKPSPALLCKLGSIIVHADEMLSSDGHQFDLIALKSVLNDNDVRCWLTLMGSMSMIPLKRSLGKSGGQEK